VQIKQLDQNVETTNKVVKSDNCKWVKEKCWQRWQNEWRSYTSSMVTTKPHVNRYKSTEGLPRQQQVAVSRLRMGYTNKTHGYKIRDELKPNICLLSYLKTKLADLANDQRPKGMRVIDTIGKWSHTLRKGPKQSGQVSRRKERLDTTRLRTVKDKLPRGLHMKHQEFIHTVGQQDQQSKVHITHY
jgi:hypothetical protein